MRALSHFYQNFTRWYFHTLPLFDMYAVYEDIFNRIPLSLVKYSWFLKIFR